VDGSAIASGEVTLAVGTGSAVSVGASAVGPAGAGAGQTASSAYAKVQAINAAGISGLTATADSTLQVAFTTTTNAGATDTYSLTINGQAIYTANRGVKDGATVATAINSNSSATGVTASFDSVSGLMTLNASDGRDIIISQSLGAGATANTGLNGTGGGTNNTVNAALAFNTAAGATTNRTGVGTIRLTAASQIVVGGTTPARIGYTGGGTLALGNAALNSSSVTTVANANTTITQIDAALTSVNSLRSTLGAIQNRFASAVTTIQSAVENETAARSRIQDTDFASETANLTRAQILQQAGTAMLAQANALPNTVLSLLK
jgi:flagellin